VTKHADVCVDERCSLCGESATHKVEESPRCQDEGVVSRHPFTNYVCCEHFGKIMGALAEEWCHSETSAEVIDEITVNDVRRAAAALRYAVSLPAHLKELAYQRIMDALDRLDDLESEAQDTQVAGEGQDQGETDRDRPTDRTEPRRPPSSAPGMDEVIDRVVADLDDFGRKMERVIRNLSTHFLGEDLERDEAVRRGWRR
jgi:hypothetical protein